MAEEITKKQQIEFKLVNNSLYININDFLSDVQLSMKRIREVQRNMQKTQNDHVRFKWNQQLLYKFTLIVSQLGIKSVKPKQIQHYFIQEGLTNHQIGSHLQKYKLKLLKQYNIKSLSDIENTMCLDQFSNYPEIKSALQKWSQIPNDQISQDSGTTHNSQSNKDDEYEQEFRIDNYYDVFAQQQYSYIYD